MSNYLFIVNPTSGKGKGKRAISTIDNYCKNKDLDYKIIETKNPLHATQIIQENSELFQNLISCGGDGTLNEVVNGFNLGSDNKLGVLPVGSGNDFTKNLGFASSVEENLEILCNPNHKTRIIDIGNIRFRESNDKEEKKHKFINNCGIGFDAR